MTVLAVIPARAGSKSIKNKNILPFNGKPLFQWSVEVAMKTELISDVIVTSDSHEILNIAKRIGAKTLLRPKQIAADFSRDSEYISHLIEKLDEIKFQIPPMYIIILRPTCPSRHSSDINKAIYRFKQLTDADSMRSVRLCTETPYKMWIDAENSDGSIIPVIGESSVVDHVNAPRQLLPKVYWQDGYLEMIRISSFVKGLYPGNVYPWHNNKKSLDIDHIDDLPNEVRKSLHDFSDYQPLDHNKYSS